MSVEKSIYALGYVYAVAERALPKIFDRSEKKTAYSESPMKYLAEILKDLISNNALSDVVDKKLSVLLDSVDPDTPEHIPADMQGRWWAGYYAGKNNPEDLISIPHKSNSGVGNKIKQLRSERGMTQVELAEKLGVLQKDVSRWELGKVEPKPETIQKISEVLNASVTP